MGLITQKQPVHEKKVQDDIRLIELSFPEPVTVLTSANIPQIIKFIVLRTCSNGFINLQTEIFQSETTSSYLFWIQGLFIF